MFVWKRILIGLTICLFIYFLPSFKNSNDEYESYFNLICLIVFGIDSLINTTLSSSMIAFFARIADESIGGTYMTFLTTLKNFGKQRVN